MSGLNEVLEMNDRERLLSFGYKPHHIIEFEDGSAVLDCTALHMEVENMRIFSSIMAYPSS